jgi:site-specific recombinase
VAFSSSHIAYGSYAVGLDWISHAGFVIVLSIFVIGIVNFLVSFFLTMLIALKAKDLRSKDVVYGFVYALGLFLRKPWKFILPLGFNK